MSMQSQAFERKMNVRSIQKMKGVEPITMVTAYDALFAGIFDGEVEMILVGDSLTMSFYAEPDTLSATMEQMLYHSKAVCKGAERSLVVFDMPFGSYTHPQQALENAVRVYRETCAEAVKIEGGQEKAEIVRLLSENGIAVLAHIGLMPQSVRAEGGYRVQGRSEEEARKLMEDALALQEAGAFALLLEGMVSEVATKITEAVSIPTIGIGAGNGTDGQVLVWSDMFGFFEAFKPKFVKRYLNGAELIREGLRQYREEVKSRAFPDEKHSY